jgi:serine/threonine protein kinase
VDQALIKTVHGYGYRLLAPVSVEATRAAAPPKLDFSAGDHPPLRPLWSLVQRLGTGGQGEVWLARHDKTGDARVYKFAYDLAGLSAIKREITLYRVLRDTLGKRDDIAGVMDWNLEEAPYFIELEHVAAGNLEAWAAQDGGLAAIALTTRLEIVARVADALAAAHSVGVLHKDLKPSNVLIDADGHGAPTIKLTDFGSGGVDPAQVAALGITQLGFTRSVVADAAGTPIYTAPEVMAGQPCTVQGDIYSLGVVLYQMVAGNLREPLAPGWEDRIEDELLREDIRAAVDRNPARRLPDASLLATRLRTLEHRRRQRAAEQAERERLAAEQRAVAERARAAEITLARFRARRNWMLTSLSVLIVGFAISVSLYVEARRARNEATAHAASSQAVAEFLSKDMFSVVGERPLRDLTVRELLEGASAKLSDKVNDTPLSAAQIHASLGQALFAVEAFAEAEPHFATALRLYEKAGQTRSAEAVSTAAQLLSANYVSRTMDLDLARIAALASDAESQLGSRHPAVLGVKRGIAEQKLRRGAFAEAAGYLRELLTAANDPLTRLSLGHALTLQGEFENAIAALDTVIRELGASRQPPANLATAYLLRGQARLELERFSDARADLDHAEQLTLSWSANEAYSHLLVVRWLRGMLLLREGKPLDAIRTLENVLRQFSQPEWHGQPDMTAEARRTLAQAYAEVNQVARAETELRAAVRAARSTFGSKTPWHEIAFVDLAAIRIRRGAIKEARDLLATVDRSTLERLGSRHPHLGQLYRVEGLLALAEGRPSAAVNLLQKSVEIFEACYGGTHSLIHRGRLDLDGAKAALSSRDRSFRPRDPDVSAKIPPSG